MNARKQDFALLALMIAALVASLVLLRRRPLEAVAERVQSDGPHSR